MIINAKIASSLEKVLPGKAPCFNEYRSATALKGEIFSFQVFYISEDDNRIRLIPSVKSPESLDIELFDVEFAPSLLPAYRDRNDEDYITTQPGLFPDVLRPVPTGQAITALNSCWKALWVAVNLPQDLKRGKYPIQIELIPEGTDTPIWFGEFEIEAIDAVLPPQELIFTQWFHCDCLASYYRVPALSEEHWRIIENYMRNAARYGMNMILTPIFTPPLDTAVGGERMTIQLVGVSVHQGEYSFDFTKLKRYIDTATRCGIKYFEISHLFTQWGAKAAPKVIATVDGEERRIFGWDTASDSQEYRSFLVQMITELKSFLKKEGVLENCYFHISDEPHLDHLESYRKAREGVSEALKGCRIIDALSNYDFYSEGLVDNPIPAIDHIRPFIENNVQDLWAYYCCCQCVKVSNRFFSMPSYRNRILGYQLYKFDIKGFLQWGYNFWFSQYSSFSIDPYRTTDADGAFPSGDAFSVYPGEGGSPIPSLRQLVFNEALQDLRALRLLERLAGRQKVLELLDENFGAGFDFENYPRSAEKLLEFRETVNRMIAEYL